MNRVATVGLFVAVLSGCNEKAPPASAGAVDVALEEPPPAPKPVSRVDRLASGSSAHPEPGIMDTKRLSERDICTKFITPALRQAGWDEMLQIREEVSFTKGRTIVRGKLVSRARRDTRSDQDTTQGAG